MKKKRNFVKFHESLSTALSCLNARTFEGDVRPYHRNLGKSVSRWFQRRGCEGVKSSYLLVESQKNIVDEEGQGSD
jgi:hypothetical protein